MPISYEIDPNRRLVTTSMTGIVTDDDVHDQRRTLRADPRFDPDYRQLIDLTGITEPRVTSAAVMGAANDQYFTPGVRRAFLAGTDATFGLARMFALRTEGKGQTIEVFRDRKKAEEWLGI